MIARALTLAATLYAVAASAFDNFDPVPGGIAGVTVAESGAAAPTAWFGSHRLPVLDLERGRVAVVGLDLDLAPGFYVVNVVDDEDHHDSRRFPVRPLARPIYTIEVPDEPPLAELVARHREALAVPGVAPAADGETPDLDFVLPVDLPIRFQFGRLNFGGTGLTAPFPGLGFVSDREARVASPSFGQVIAVDARDGAWRVVIHHGGGVVSMFRHLAAVDVVVEQWLSKGDPIGVLPRRNNVRLLPDWAVALNAAWVDPLLLVSHRIDLGPEPAPPLAPRPESDLQGATQ